MSKVSYMGNGITTEFYFDFPYYENSNVIVSVNNEYAIGYEIVGNAAGMNADIPYNGGKVVFEVAPSGFDCITIARKLPLTRIVDYQPTEKINPMLLNQDMNYAIEILKDFFDELVNFRTKYAEITEKNSTQVLLSKIGEINRLVDSGEIMDLDRFYSYTSNCVTEIPDDVKLVLNDGTLVLKAGSRLYKPNGFEADGVTQKFDVSVMSADYVFAGGFDGKQVVLFGGIGRMSIDRVSAGTIPPINPINNDVWYDLSVNKIKIYSASQSMWQESNATLPIGLATVNADGTCYVSIDQVFNGFGFIGTTVFVLPGVKGFACNGRKSDGTLKSFPVLINKVKTQNYSKSYGDRYFILDVNGAFVGGSVFYNNKSKDLINNQEATYLSDKNEIYRYGGVGVYKVNGFLAGVLRNENNIITSFKPKQVFNILDCNNGNLVANQSMPSDVYTDLILGDSGVSYLVPADGYLVLKGEASVAGKEYVMINESNNMTSLAYVQNSGGAVALSLPVSSGQVVSVKYGAALKNNYVFRFVYSNGAK